MRPPTGWPSAPWRRRSASTFPDVLCEALLVQGRCARTHDFAAAAQAFERAATVARDGGLVHREARALTELGTPSRRHPPGGRCAIWSRTPSCAPWARSGSPPVPPDGWGEPAAWYELALGTFTDRGLVEPAEACRRGLRELGGGSTSGADGLTAREEDVLALVAQGLSNRLVAERLLLSPRTVEKHVERLLAKTGSANRGPLVAYVMRHPRLRGASRLRLAR